MKKLSELEIITAGEKVLFEQLGPVNATRFWVALTTGNGDYLKVKDRLFKNETIESLYDDIKAFANEKRSKRV